MNAQEIKTDYHMHSTFSVDGQDTIETLCWRALALGLTEIAITEHAEWHPQWHAGAPAFDDYFEEINRLRSEFGPRGLTLYSGVELGDPHEFQAQARELVGRYPFDVRLASLHWLYGENIHDASCFAGREPLDVYADYFSAVGHMAAESSNIDVIAHFDRILWRGTLLGAAFRPQSLESIIRDTLATIAWRGLALELNTKLLNLNPGWRSALVTMLQWYHEEGGRRVVVNSDAHRASQIGANLEQARLALSEAGLQPATLQSALSLA